MNNSHRDISATDPLLIIESDDGFAELMCSALTDGGHCCCKTTCGVEAFDWLTTRSASLIILDYSLPDMTGSSFIEKIRSMGIETPFVMVTARNDTTLAVAMMKSGACDFIIKDASFIDRLPAVVSRAVQEQITWQQLRMAETSLRQSETRLARAQKIARMGSWEWNLITGDIYWSDELYRIFGHPVGHPAVISMDWLYTLINPLDLTPFKKAVRNTVKSGAVLDINYRIISSNENEIVVNSQGEVEYDEDGRACLLSGTTLDITARIKAESEIQHLINYDSLTGLPNRSLLHDRLHLAIAQATRDKHLLGVLMLDLDRFKDINETLGHRAGDKLLKAVSKRLQVCLRDSDTLARLGGDEYVAILVGVTHEDGITTVAKKILSVVAEPFYIDGTEIFSTCSIGIAVYPLDGEDSHTLLKHADLAMYQAKGIDRNNFQFFSREMNNLVLERMMLENSIRKGLEREEFFLVYQPQVDGRTGKIFGMEALLRWNHPDMGPLAPDKFIGLAEENGLIIPLGEWVLRSACRQNKAWQQQGLPPVRVAVNLSAKQFGQYHLDEIVAATLLETGLDPEWLELELTESILMKDAEQNAALLRKFKDMGISLAIDDFGTGYSSLSYLKNFPISRLKIDRSFVRDITTNPDDAAIARIIIDIARALNLSVIAEGVETRAQMQFLSFNNCVEMQGYLFSKPVRVEEFTELLRNGLKL
jgi:diguanylate cyclase (GGDEF)-like protein